MGDQTGDVRRRQAGGLWQALKAAADKDSERWPFLIPVAYGCGIAVYFSWATEPPVWLAPMAVALLLAAWLLLRGWRAPMVSGLRLLLLLLAMAALGQAVADGRTGMQVGPVLDSPTGIRDISGRVVRVERLNDGRPRVTLAPERTLLAPMATPWTLRVRLLPNQEPPQVGVWISLRGGLLPPSGPAFPGGFDFRRHLAFQGIGAVGFAVTPWQHAAPTTGSAPISISLGERAALAMADVRRVIAERVAAAVPDPASAAVATALLTGDRAGIPDAVSVALRDAGIAHLLAISGLHVGLVAGLVFVTLRMIGALVPRIALGWPLKKLAASAALLAAILYMVLVGAPVPTQRAVLMGGLVLLVILVDRRALTLRLVAIAAMVVMTVEPASLPGPSFQMSFAAVLALVAGWRGLAPYLSVEREEMPGLGTRFFGYVLGLLGTSIIASAATGLFALYHFQRIAAAGIVANLWAVPLTAFIIMPLGVMGAVAIPLGVDAPFFATMGWAIGLLIDSAVWVSQGQGAALSVPMMPLWGLLLGTVGGLWLLLTQAWWRWFGLLALWLALASPMLAPTPLILAEAEGRVVAVVMDGEILPSDARSAVFVQDQWARALALPRGEGWSALAGRPPRLEPSLTAPGELGENGANRIACDRSGCVLSRGAIRIALPLSLAALREDCSHADILITVDVVPSDRCQDIPTVDRAALLLGEGGWLLPPPEPGSLQAWLQALTPMFARKTLSQGVGTMPLPTGWQWIPVRPIPSSRPWHPGFPPIDP